MSSRPAGRVYHDAEQRQRPAGSPLLYLKFLSAASFCCCANSISRADGSVGSCRRSRQSARPANAREQFSLKLASPLKQELRTIIRLLAAGYALARPLPALIMRPHLRLLINIIIIAWPLLLLLPITLANTPAAPAEELGLENFAIDPGHSPTTAHL